MTTEANAYLYTLKCQDDRYYVGSTRGSLEKRIAEHNAGTYGGYTKKRRPVELIFAEEFQKITDAIARERQLKGWSRAKKEALSRGDFGEIQNLAQKRSLSNNPSTSSG